MQSRGIATATERLLVTTGSQQGLDLVARVLLDPGDVVLVELPTYTGAITAFRNVQSEMIGVRQESDGICLEALDETYERLRREGRRVRLLYVVPNFQNPTGVTLAAGRRRELLDIAREFDLVIVEDNPYGMLRFGGESLPTIASLEGGETGVDRVVYLGTFSKIFAPGVRLGWVHAQPGILHKLNIGKQGADLCSSNLSQMLLYSYFRNADWRSYVKRLTGIYRERRDAMLGALAEFMPNEVHWTHPEGGLFVWMTLPSYVNATDMLPQAVKKNVAYVPGEGFYVGGAGENCMRLNFSFVEPEQIRQGIEILSDVVRERMELRDDLERATQRRGMRQATRPAIGTDL
jgi:2-aminoadipate transaminase